MKYIKLHSFILFSLYFNINTCNCIQNMAMTFTKDYFLSKHIHQMVNIGCWDSFEKIEYLDIWRLFRIQTSYVNIKNNYDLREVFKINYYKLGIVLDLHCPQIQDFFKQLENEKIAFNETYYWLIMTNSSELPVEILKNLPLSIATEMTLAVQQQNTYLLYDIYNPSYRHGGSLNITFMGTWSIENGINNWLSQYKYKRRQNMFGLTLNFSIFLNYEAKPNLETYLTTPINRHLDTMIRFHYNIILQLRDIYNFTIHMTRTNTWGYLINGTYNGVVGDIVKGIVDIGGAPMQYKRERLDVLEYTVPTYIARSCIIFRHPKSNQVRNVFLKPFMKDVWYMVLFVTIVYWLLLLLTVKLELHYKCSEPACTLETNPKLETALITTAAICQQGLSDGPRIYSGRIIFLSLFLWGFILFQFYSASIVGSLLSQPPRFITNLKALLDSNLDVGIEDMAYNYDYFATTTDPIAHKIEKQKVMPNKKRKKANYFSYVQGLKGVQQGGFAFQVDSATAYRIIRDTFTEDQICDLQEVQLFPAKYVSTVTAKNSPFKKMLTYALRKINEHGLAYRLRHLWHERKPQCPESHSSNPVPIGIHDFSSALIILFVGIIFSLCIMLIEILIERFV